MVSNIDRELKKKNGNSMLLVNLSGQWSLCLIFPEKSREVRYKKDKEGMDTMNVGNYSACCFLVNNFKKHVIPDNYTRACPGYFPGMTNCLKF